MKASVQDGYGQADVLRLGEVDRPTAGPDEVLVRVHAAGVDAGVWHMMSGMPYVARVATGLRRPRTRVPGMDLAGTVEAVGATVTGFRPGDEVFGAGRSTFAEYAVAKADKLMAKPAALTFEQAAAAPVSGATAVQGLCEVGRLRAGQRVMVIGAGGGVGSFAVQVAKAYGATVTGVCSTSKVDFVRKLGADDVVDYTRDDLGTGTHDLVLDMAGNRPLSTLRRRLAPGGTL